MLLKCVFVVKVRVNNCTIKDTKYNAMTDNDNGVGDGGGVVLLRNNVVNN